MGLPKTREEALNIASFVMDVQRCVNCGHVYHTQFDFERIPYRSHSNMVYNHAPYWQAFQNDLAEEWIETYNLRSKRILEIGCGEGLFLKRFLREDLGNTGFAYEPGPDAENARRNGIETVRQFFHAAPGLSLKPDVIICRHVIEHLADPFDFILQIAIECNLQNQTPLVFAEVPQIDKALRLGRINDFLYEHVSNFTLNSFRTLFELGGYEILDISSRYDEEVIDVVARPILSGKQTVIRDACNRFRSNVDTQVTTVCGQIEAWVAEGKKIAFWAGTGKGAAFLNMFGFDHERYPVVVDSDPLKAGGFVPGTGQQIRRPEYLNEHPVDVIVITTQWRAPDIRDEILRTIQNDVEIVSYEEGRLEHLPKDGS